MYRICSMDEHGILSLSNLSFTLKEHSIIFLIIRQRCCEHARVNQCQINEKCRFVLVFIKCQSLIQPSQNWEPTFADSYAFYAERATLTCVNSQISSKMATNVCCWRPNPIAWTLKSLNTWTLFLVDPTGGTFGSYEYLRGSNDRCKLWSNEHLQFQ